MALDRRPVQLHAQARRGAQLPAVIGHQLADPDAARALGRTRGVPAARGPFQALVDGGGLPPLALAAYRQIQQQRGSAEGIGLPNPLFEHARLHRLMREVFETVAYGKATDAEAARLVDEGNAMLRRIH
ncbi:MAG TPA: hypothetical protein PK306_10905 [Aquabacterium sp.]|nr:hypothetical protein [Aquabacterium sp.]HQC96205.1 hypothetical protein [Aquabacterium sp.]